MLRTKMNLIPLSLLLLLLNYGQVAPAFAYQPIDHEDDYIQSVDLPIYGPIYTTIVTPISQAQVEPPNVQYHVQAGDTLYQIARDFGVTVEALTAANDIRNPRLLMIGRQLQIPTDESPLGLPDGNQQVRKVLNTTLTAYTAGLESTGKTPSNPMYGITYSGSIAEEGRTIAVDPAVIPLGSTVFIDGLGIRTAEDTGAAIRGSRIDVFMNDFGQAIEFGVKKNVKVYVLSVL